MKYPFVEPIFIFVIVIFVSLFSGLFVGERFAISDENWRIIDSCYFQIFIGLVIIGIIYYCKFSVHSIRKQDSSFINADDIDDIGDIVENLKEELEKVLKDPRLNYETKLIYAEKTVETIQTIRKADNKSSGGMS